MEELRSFFTDRKNVINLLVLGILVLGIPVGTQLIRNQQFLRSSAAGEPIQFLPSPGNVENRNGTWVARKPKVTLVLNSPFPRTTTQTTYVQPQLVSTAYAYDAFCRNEPAPNSKGSETCWSHDGKQEYCDVVWDPVEGDACYWNCRTQPGCGEAESAPPESAQPDPCSGTPPENGYSLDGCKPGVCGVEVWYCNADSNQKKERSNLDGNCGQSQFNGACNTQSAPDQPAQQPQTPDGNKCIDGVSDATASDGLHFCDQSAEIQGEFKTAFGSDAAARWVQQRNADLSKNQQPQNDKCKRYQQQCADANGIPGIHWCIDSSCPNAGCYVNATSDQKDNTCKNEHPEGPGSGTSACWVNGGYISQKSADDGCSHTYDTPGLVCKQKVDSTTRPDGCTLTPAGSAGPSTTSGNVGVGTSSPKASNTKVIKYRLANDPVTLQTTGWKDYTSDPTTVDWSLDTSTPRGRRMVWVEFMDEASGQTDQKSAEITLLGDPPAIAGTACDLDLNTGNLNFKVSGSNFGADSGDISTPTGGLKMLGWKDNQVVATLENPGKVSRGQPFTIVVTRSDGEKVQDSCKVGTSQLSFGAKIFCRAPSSATQEGVELTIADAAPGGKKVKQTVSIEPNGMVSGLQTVLEEGKAYKLSIKAPKSLRKTVTFIASAGTTNIPNFNLPIGDIFPAGGDDVINNMDYAELKREWSLTNTSLSRSGDFNSDGQINSFDFACMKYDFNRSSDPMP